MSRKPVGKTPLEPQIAYFRSKSVGTAKFMEGLIQGKNGKLYNVSVGLPGGTFNKFTQLEMKLAERNISKDVKYGMSEQLKALRVEFCSSEYTFAHNTIHKPLIGTDMAYRVKKIRYLDGNPMNKIQVPAEVATKRTVTNQFLRDESFLPSLTGNKIHTVLKKSVIKVVRKVSVSPLVGGFPNINMPAIGPSTPTQAPTEEDLLELFLTQCLEFDDTITYEDVREGKGAVAVVTKAIVDWQQADTPGFWKNYRPKNGDLPAEAEQNTPGAKALYHIGVIGEHQGIAETLEEFNPADKPWVWVMPDDRDNLVQELSDLYKDKGSDTFFDFLTKYKYKNKVRLPRYVACDVAIDAIYDTLKITDEKE